ncbi:MAG: DUF4926 domain-containing protein [Spirochaetales bacterium]|nr:DUF4926 domain-containing protein [Spirochaetales bacterium]
MLNELETVVINKDIPEYGLIRGDIGAMVHIYENGSVVEVEFVSGEGSTVGVITLPKEDLRQIAHDEILHVRELHSA